MMIKPRRWLPVNVSEFTDRHGSPRYRFRKAGLPPVYLTGEPGSDAFLASLAAARAQQQAPAPIISRAVPGSIRAVCEHWYGSPNWQNLTPATRDAYRRPLEKFCEAHGDKPAALVNAGHLDRILGKMADRPGAANNLRKALGRVFRHAIKMGWRSDNPATITDPFKAGPGFHAWSEEEIGQFCDRWPLGTKPRLALELALNTAARRCDLVKIGRANMKDGRFHIQHAKGGNKTSVAILPECQAAIDAMAVTGIETLLITSFGKPFTVAGRSGVFADPAARRWPRPVQGGCCPAESGGD